MLKVFQLYERRSGGDDLGRSPDPTWIPGNTILRLYPKC
jgi:hypothetical protein